MDDYPAEHPGAEPASAGHPGTEPAGSEFPVSETEPVSGETGTESGTGAASDTEAPFGAEATAPVGPAHECLAVGFVPGVMPSKWFHRWDQRMEGAPSAERIPLDRVPLPEGGALEALVQEHAHMVLLRPQAEPDALDSSRFHTVHLYEEQPVVVLPVEHLLTVLDEVPVEDLGEEFLLQDPDEVPEWRQARARYAAAHPEQDLTTRLPQMRDRADAVELVAVGLGLLVLPLSLARFHHRKDLTYRPVTGVATSSVSLVWPRLVPGIRPEADEAVLQEFVGITRGRRAESSRGDLVAGGNGAGKKKERVRRTTASERAKKAAPQKDRATTRSGASAGGRESRQRPGASGGKGRKSAGRNASSPRGRR